MQFNPPQIVNYSSPSADAAHAASYAVLVALIVGIVYYQHVPAEIARFFKSFWGRLAGFIVLMVLVEYGGLMHGLFWVILFLLVQIHSTELQEAFSGLPFVIYNEGGGRKTTYIVPDKNQRWYVERALGETPHAIEETEVRTYAVDDDTNQPFSH
jgi:hypothetical protein